MLKDITPRREDERSPMGRLIAAVAGRDTGSPKKVADGVWLFGHWNPEFGPREADRTLEARYGAAYGR